MGNKKWFLLRGPSQQVDHVPVSGMNIIYLDILKKSCLFYSGHRPFLRFQTLIMPFFRRNGIMESLGMEMTLV
jgi:hypothetical protein